MVKEEERRFLDKSSAMSLWDLGICFAVSINPRLASKENRLQSICMILWSLLVLEFRTETTDSMSQ